MATKEFEPQASADLPVDRKAVLGEALRRRILSMELAPGAVVDALSL